MDEEETMKNKNMNTLTPQTSETQEFDTPLEKIDNSLSEVFNTNPMDVTVIDEQGVVAPDEDIDVDYSHVRSNMYSIIQQGNSALQYALELAKSSDSPRAFEVVGTLMKNLSDINIQLLDSHEKKLKIKKPKEQEQPQKVVNNSIVFTGTTNEINKMLEQMKKEQ